MPTDDPSSQAPSECRPCSKPLGPPLVAVLIAVLMMFGTGVAMGAQDAGAAATPAETAAPAEASEPDPALATPSDTMRTYLEAMAEATSSTDGAVRGVAWDRALKCFEFASLEGRTARQSVAVKLKGVLDRIKTVDYWWDFAAYRDNPADDRYVYFPQIEGPDYIPEHRRVAKLTDSSIVMQRGDDGAWRFSAATVESVNALYRDLESLPEQFGSGEAPLTLDMQLRAMMPRELKDSAFLNVEYWQWLGIAAIVLLGFIADLLTRLILRGLWSRVDRARGIDRDRSLIKRVVWPFGLFAAATVWIFAGDFLGLPPTPHAIVKIAARLVLTITSVLAAFRLVDIAGAWLHAKAAATTTKVDDLLVPLMRKTFKTLIIIVAAIYIAESFSVRVLPLLTGLGIGGLAVAFAAKDTIENFFGSIAVIVDRPFEIGDWVAIGDVEGTVEAMGLRSTRVRTFYNSLVSVPNASLVRATVDNYGRRRFRRFKATLSLTYDTPPEKIEAFCEAVRELVRVHPYTRKDSYHVWLNSFGAHSLDVLLYIFHECPDWSVELRERQRMMLDILRVADKLGVSFAFPTQTIHLTRDDADTAPAPTPSRSAELAARQIGVEAASDITSQAAWKQRTPGPVRFDGAGPDGFARREGIESED